MSSGGSSRYTFFSFHPLYKWSYFQNSWMSRLLFGFFDADPESLFPASFGGWWDVPELCPNGFNPE